MTARKSRTIPSGVRREIPATARETRWVASDGAAIRRIDWRPPEQGPRGSILFLPGRGDAYEKWLEAFEEWRLEGWAVTSVDWRGQALSGRFGPDELTGHIDDFSIWTDDLAALWSDWRSTAPGPHVVVAHSMGGHLALRAIAEGRILPDALVLTAPMLGLLPAWVPSGALHLLAKALSAFGSPSRPAWKGSERPELVHHARSRLLTHDVARYDDEEWWRQQRPQIAMGAASWGWIERALHSIRVLEKPGVLESVHIPVLLIGTTADRLVSWKAIRRAAARLPESRLVTLGPECRHEILREADPVRDLVMEEIRMFLDRVAPAAR